MRRTTAPSIWLTVSIPSPSESHSVWRRSGGLVVDGFKALPGPCLRRRQSARQKAESGRPGESDRRGTENAASVSQAACDSALLIAVGFNGCRALVYHEPSAPC
jgi:hypothetical protein